MAEEVSLVQFGQLQQAVQTLTEQVKSLSKDVEILSSKVESLNETLARVKGGWWVLGAILTTIVTISGFASWAFSHLAWRV